MKNSSVILKVSMFAAFVSLAALSSAQGARAPDPADQAAPDKTAVDDAKRQDELTALGDKAQQLNEQVRETMPSPMGSPGDKANMKMKRDGSPGPAMGMMGKMNDAQTGEMGKMGAGMPMSQPGDSDGMGKMDKMGGMEMMGMRDMRGPAAMQSTLPGFPGQSRLYHIGATGFFLDHPEHVALTPEQQQALMQRKDQAMAQQSALTRRIEQAEQELWDLTASDQPQAGAIDKKARSIEKLRADQRIAFIRAVGDAAKVLTDHQRHQLTGLLPPEPAADAPIMSSPDQAGDGTMQPMEPMEPMESMEPMEHSPEM